MDNNIVKDQVVEELAKELIDKYLEAFEELSK